MDHRKLVTYAIAAAVIAVVFALRWRRMSTVRPLRLERLWIFPAFYAVVAVATFAARPPAGWGWVFCLVALVAGAGLGWQRGRMMRIAIDPDTHALNQTASPGAMLFVVLLIAVKGGAQGALGGGALGGGALHLDAAAITDMLVALALGLFGAQRLEMFLRGRRLLRAARMDRA